LAILLRYGYIKGDVILDTLCTMWAYIVVLSYLCDMWCYIWYIRLPVSLYFCHV